MKIVVFGASGGVGQHVVEQALRAGSSVRAVYRADSAADAQPNLEVKRLETLFESDALADVIGGADAVISCLGPRRANPKNPWSKVTSPLDLMERFATALVDAMSRAAMPKKLAVVSAAGVGASAPLMHPVFRLLFDHSNVGLGYRDLARMEEQLARSDLDWVAARPVTLTTGPLTGRVERCERYGLTNTISRADVAAFLLQCLTGHSENDSRTPMICTK